MSEVLRPNYFQGQFLGAEDFEAEQRFHRDQQRRHALGHHTWGIVVGLELVERGDEGAKEVFVQPGMAVDGYGRELIIWRPTLVDVAQLVGLGAGDVGVWLVYDEEAAGRSDLYCGDLAVYERMRQVARLSIEPDDPDSHSISVDGDDIKPPGPTNEDDLVAPYDESVPYQEFPAGQPPWCVRLGSITWDGSKIETTDPEKLAGGRRYTGSVAQQLLSPISTLRIADRLASPDETDSSYARLCAVLEGYLEVVKRMTTPQVGIFGISDEDAVVVDSCKDSEVANLHVMSGETISAAGENLAYAVMGTKDGTYLMLDNEGAQVFAKVNNETEPALLKLQPRGGDLAVHTNKLYVCDDENVGIGTATPLSTLHVKANAPILAIDGQASSQLSLQINETPKARLYFDTTGTGQLRVDVHDKLALEIDHQQRVGIGTSNPNERLEINGAVRGSVDENGALRISTPTGTTDIGSQDAGASHFKTSLPLYSFDKDIWIESGLIRSPSQDLQLWTTGPTARVTIDSSSGNVGIGRDPSATAKLDVQGRILRMGQQFSFAGTASHGETVSPPWGTRDDWNILVSPRDFIASDPYDLEDEALLGIECWASPVTGTSWQIHARFTYREEIEEPSWQDGSVNYILIPK